MNAGAGEAEDPSAILKTAFVQHKVSALKQLQSDTDSIAAAQLTRLSLWDAHTAVNNSVLQKSIMAAIRHSARHVR